MATTKKTTKKTAPKKPATKPDPPQRTQNKVREPKPGTQSRQLWGICDKLKSRLHRSPARFEFREEVSKLGAEVNADSASFQYFQWRKFHGIPGHATGIYPARNSFKPSEATKTRTATKKTGKKKAAAKKATKKKTVKKAAKKAAKKKTTKKVAKKKAATKKAAKK
jgi:hypothetical protein